MATTRRAVNWATSRVLALLEICVLVAGVCVLLRWQTIRCLLEHARGRRTLDSMAPQPCATPEASDWATDRVTALPEFWTLVAEHSGIVGAWRLPGVCRASRVEGMAANAAAAGGVRRVGHARGRRLLHEGGVEAGSGAASLGADV